MPRNSSVVAVVLPRTAPPAVLTTGDAIAPLCLMVLLSRPAVTLAPAAVVVVAPRAPRAMAPAQNRAPARQPRFPNTGISMIWAPLHRRQRHRSVPLTATVA